MSRINYKSEHWLCASRRSSLRTKQPIHFLLQKETTLYITQVESIQVPRHDCQRFPSNEECFPVPGADVLPAIEGQ